MFQFFGNQTQAQVAAAIASGGFVLASFSVVAPDTQYTTGSVTVILFTDAKADTGTGYRTAVTGGIAGGKTYVAGLVNGSTALQTAFYAATVDDGQGTTFTLADVEAW